MPRSARERSESGFYHVIAKGNGGQNLFEDASDYRAFLELAAAAAGRASGTFRRRGRAIIALVSARGSQMPRPARSRGVSLAILPQETSKRWSDRAAMRYSLTLRMRACPCVRSRG